MLLEAHLREDAIRHRVRLEIKQMGQRLLDEQVKRVEEAGEPLREPISGWLDQTRGSSL